MAAKRKARMRRGKEDPPAVCHFEIKRVVEKDGPAHRGTVWIHPKRTYSFEVWDRYRGGCDSTGWTPDQGCEWFLQFGHEELPNLFLRSDHKSLRRVVCGLVLAYEAGVAASKKMDSEDFFFANEEVH